MSNHVIQVKSCQIMSFISNHFIHVIIHVINHLCSLVIKGTIEGMFYKFGGGGSKSAFKAFGRKQKPT
jgi:hypothetical protein